MLHSLSENSLNHRWDDLRGRGRCAISCVCVEAAVSEWLCVIRPGGWGNWLCLGRLVADAILLIAICFALLRYSVRYSEMFCVTAVRCALLRYSVHYGDMLCFIAICCALLQYTVHYCDMLCFIVICCASLRYACSIVIICALLQYNVHYCGSLCLIAICCVLLQYSVCYCGILCVIAVFCVIVVFCALSRFANALFAGCFSVVNGLGILVSGKCLCVLEQLQCEPVSGPELLLA